MEAVLGEVLAGNGGSLYIAVFSFPHAQIHKYTNTQIHKYINTQINKYTMNLNPLIK